MKRINLIFLLVLLLNGMRTFAQSPGCSGAMNLVIKHTPSLFGIDTVFNTTVTEKWFSVTGAADSAVFKLLSYSSGYQYKLNKIELFKGTCSALTFIKKDSVENSIDTTLLVGTGNYAATDTLFLKVSYASNANCGACNITNLKFQFILSYFNLSSVACPGAPPSGCNILRNGDFEDYSTINPGGYNISNACGWGNLTTGSCDYFSSTLPPGFFSSVPCNIFGYELPHTGSGYAGFGCTGTNTNPETPNGYYEYLTRQLEVPLIANTTYTISFWLSLSESSLIKADKIGAYFYTSPSAIPPAVSGTNLQIPYSPSCIVSVTNVQKSGWTQYTMTFTPTVSGLQYMAIGAFPSSYAQVACSNSLSGCLNYSGCNWYAYYYIDDISVTGTVTMPDVHYPFCAGYPLTLTTTLQNPVWFNGATSQSISVVNFFCCGYQVTGINSNGCPAVEKHFMDFYPASETITINPNPVYLCPTQTVTLTASGLSNGNYNWVNGTWSSNETLPPTWPTIGTGSSYTYTEGQNPTNTMTVWGYTTNGCATRTVVVVNSVPQPNATINTTNTTMCSGAGNVGTYTAQPQAAGAVYTWSVTAGTSSVPFTVSPNGQSITVNWSSYMGSTTNAQVCLTVSYNNQGCSASTCLDVAPCCVPSAAYIVLNGSTDPNNPTALSSTTLPGIGGANVNASVSLNGYFAVTGTVTLSNMRLAMGPGARITVPSGASLGLSECHFFGCTQMWDGVYTTGGAINFAKRNLFEDALNAVVVQNNMSVLFKDVYFNKCHIGIDIRTASANYPGYIYQCYFTSRNFGINTSGTTMPSVYLGNTGIPANYPTGNYTYYPTANILAPYSIGRGHIGVNITEHAGVTVGIASTVPSYMNIFDNLVYGIHGTFSNVYVVNNKFIYIQEYCTGICREPFQVSSCPPGTAVCTGNTVAAQGPVKKITKVGLPSTGTTTYPNYFENDQYGVYNSTNRDLDARDNQFTIIDKTGIYNALSSNYYKVGTLINYPANVLTVTGNIMDRAQTGVHFNDNRNAVMTISNNNFNWVNWNTTTTQQSVSGIIVNNAVVHTVGSLQIARNNIANLQKGITLTLQGYTGTGTANRVYVGQNQIRYNQLQNATVAVQHYGVGVFSSKRVTVDGDNTLGEIIRVTGSAATLNNSTGQRDLFNGVRIEDSPESWVTDLNITNVPAGIYAKGACAGSDFWCNTFTSAFNGVFLNNANVGDQLNLAAPYYHAATGNQWNLNIDRKVLGAASPSIYWYYGPGAAYNPNPSVGVTGVTFILADNPADACSYQTPPEEPGDPNARVVGSTTTEQPGVKTTANNSGGSNARTMGAEPSLEGYPAYLDSMGTEAAAIYNQQVNVLSDADVARQTVDEIHLRSWAQGISAFTAADSSYLCQLATQDPEIFGSAVYSAQVMVGECEGETSSARIIHAATVEEKAKVFSNSIYPNPNDGTMQADILLAKGENGVLQLMGLNGKAFAVYTLTEGPNRFAIQQPQLQAGVYVYRIVVNGVLKETAKLVIVK